MQGETDAVIGHAVLGEVVGANFLAAVAGADHGAALCANRLLLLFEFDLVQARTQYALGFGPVLDLRFFVLAGNDQAGWQVRQTHRGIGGVDRLPAGAGGAECVDPNIFCLQLDFHFIGFRQDRDADGGGVDAALLLGFRNALDAMHAALVAQLAIDLVAADERDYFFQTADRRLADSRYFDAPLLGFGIARVHAEDFGGK